jgi:hypothetical protein
MPGEYEKHLNHLLKLVQHEGWRDYALAQAQKLSKHPSGLYGRLHTDLVERMKQLNEAKK